MKPYNDEFSKLPVSRQRKYQLRRIKEGKCPECGAPTGGNYLCEKHGSYQLNKRRQKANTPPGRPRSTRHGKGRGAELTDSP